MKKPSKIPAGLDFAQQKEGDYNSPFEKLDEQVVNKNKGLVYTFKPSRETMHMLIKRATNVADAYELFCESVDGFKRMQTIKSTEG